MASANYMGPKAPVTLCFEKLGAFTDHLLLRDAKACSQRPALLPHPHSGRRRLQIRDDFTLQCEHVVSASRGQQFLEITQDPNDIHAKENILPGALTVAKVLLPIEILVPALKIEALRAKFRAAAFYGERTINSMSWHYVDESSVRVDVTAYQSQRVVATASVFGEITREPLAIEEIKERKVNPDELSRVSEFMEVLGVHPEAYFDKDGLIDFTYPFAFMAALPSGEIVRQFEGVGGIINMLSLDLGDEAKMPITGSGAPEIRLKTGRVRQTFQRIITDIIDGITTYYRGAALVYPSATVL